jgi:predicted DsbA family dithiol-disulfide isomerase
VNTQQSKMKVEIWSDIMCPFCYIGKRHFEAALAQFPDAGTIELEWHSFQLDPEIPVNMPVQKNVYQYLAERKGIRYEESEKMHGNVVKMAQAAGLVYNFDKAIVANSFDAHRVIQMAKTKGLGDAAEERLFKAYFTEGQNFGDHTVLLQLGTEIGLSSAEVDQALTDDQYAVKVKQDILEAGEIGVRGVPFFVLDRKYAVSGAQPEETFLQVLNKSFTEWRDQHPVVLN